MSTDHACLSKRPKIGNSYPRLVFYGVISLFVVQRTRKTRVNYKYVNKEPILRATP